jgi:DNA-binding response OmpR family regulator
MKNKRTVLIVEDDPDIRQLMKIFIEADGFYVELAADGVEALEQLRNGSRPNLIILDLMLPRMDGEQFMKQVRDEGRFATIPVVVMSGHSEGKKKANGLKAAGFLGKPVEADELLNIVRTLAGRPSRKDAA